MASYKKFDGTTNDAFVTFPCGTSGVKMAKVVKLRNRININKAQTHASIKSNKINLLVRENHSLSA